MEKKKSAEKQCSILTVASDMNSRDMVTGLQNTGAVNITRATAMLRDVYIAFLCIVSLYYEIFLDYE